MELVTWTCKLKNLNVTEYEFLRELCRLSKNVYNESVYNIRQHYFAQGAYLRYEANFSQMKFSENYIKIGSNVAQATMRAADQSFKSFFALLKNAKQGRYENWKVRLPGYLKKDAFYPVQFIHAGEADGPESIWYALEFGAKRIGHGVRCVEDKELMKRLEKDQIPLELCPTSNLNTKIFDRIEDYPIPKLLDAGIKITINTDNMTVSDTTLERELKLVKETFHLSEKDMTGLQKNAKESIVF